MHTLMVDTVQRTDWPLPASESKHKLSTPASPNHSTYWTLVLVIEFEFEAAFLSVRYVFVLWSRVLSVIYDSCHFRICFGLFLVRYASLCLMSQSCRQQPRCSAQKTMKSI